MQIFKNLCIFLNIINISAFHNLFKINNLGLNRIKNNQKNTVFSHYIKPKTIFNTNHNTTNTKANTTSKYISNKLTNTNITKKCNGFIKIIRPNNILPTFLLCLSGGWIINPSIYNLMYSSAFIFSVINTILIMSSSMVINDLYDINIDKINSPNRPLVTGEINKIEAIIYVLSLLTASEYLNMQYLPDNLHWIIHLAIVNIIIYTPIFKKMLFIKNISCASLVSFSVFLSGLASTKEIIELNNNFGLLSITISLIFFGSLSNEILLDMKDLDGDKINNIKTIPTVFGNNFAFDLTSSIIYLNMVSNSFAISYIYNTKIATVMLVIFIPLLVNLYKIKRDNYSNISIENYMKYSNNILFTLLLFLSTLAGIFK